MGTRLQLHDQIVRFCPNMYYQPPSNIALKYPCIIYWKAEVDTIHANDKAYVSTNGYDLTVIDRNPDSPIPEDILQNFSMCRIGRVYIVDGLYHTPITLYY